MGPVRTANLNLVALLWTFLSLPIYATIEVRSVWQDRQALRRDGLLTSLSQRHFERAAGRLVLLTLIMLIGLVSLFTPFTAPTTPRGWLILTGLLLIPTMIQADGIRDHQLRKRVMRGQEPHA